MGIAEKIIKGDIQAAAMLMRGVEDERTDALVELSMIYPYTGRAHVIGLTGPPGVGKSTLIDSLIGAFRKKGMTVGVVAVDPTSPFTGGAVLGDRVRMQEHAMDRGVFIRSMATRGWRGGLSKATISMIHIMDAMGKDVILVETVGTGQSEVEITKVSDTAVLVLSPDSGDQVQVIKAGILEAADIFVVNKADKGDADYVISRVEFMLGMRAFHTDDWHPCIVMTQANSGKGAETLADTLLKHKDYLAVSGDLEKRRKVRAREELLKNVETFVRDYCYRGFVEDGHLEELVDSIAQRKMAPHSAAMKIIDWLGAHFKQIATH